MPGCGSASGEPRSFEQSAHASSTPPIAAAEAPARNASVSMETVRLTALRKQGQLAAHVAAALDALDGPLEVAAEGLVRTEALMAVGQNGAAAQMALATAELAIDRNDFGPGEQALKLWLAAQLRDKQPLASAQATQLLDSLPADDDGAKLLRFWCAELAERTPQRLECATADAELQHGSQVPLAQAPVDSLPAALNAIQVQAGDVTLPLVFIDTGAQHTLITLEAAKAAGVELGPGSTRLVGFGGLEARPGVLPRLQIGQLVVYDVPVMVGNSVQLSALKGQMSIGTELMHHVRFTVDYPGQRVLAAPAATELASDDAPFQWQIPVWTFPQVMLAEARLPTGQSARVLVDTGNRVGTFVSARWARRNLPGYHPATTPVVFKFKRRDLVLEGLELGNQSLDRWPALDTMPGELERLNLVDVLVGRDLLWPFRVTIDVRRRRLLLVGDGPPRSPQIAGEPLSLSQPNARGHREVAP